MYFKIINHVEDSKYLYDLYCEDNLILCKAEVQILHNYLLTKLRDTDIVDCILMDGKPSKFTTAMLREQATIGFEAFYAKYGEDE